MSPLTGLFFPDKMGGINTGGGTLVSLVGEGEASTLDAAVEEDAFEEVDENEFEELPDVDRSVFTTKLGIVFAPIDAKEDLPEEEDED